MLYIYKLFKFYLIYKKVFDKLMGFL